MAGSAIVEFLLKWSEQGGQLPAKIQRDLDAMGRSAHESTSITDRLGDAFQRLERREPTTVVRNVRLAVEELSASAVGASGPLGRLGSLLTTLGGPEMLLAIGGVAGLAEGIKTLSDHFDGLNTAMGEAADKFAALVPQAARLAQIEALRGQIEGLQQGGGFGVPEKGGAAIAGLLAPILGPKLAGSIAGTIAGPAITSSATQIAGYTDIQARIQQLVEDQRASEIARKDLERQRADYEQFLSDQRQERLDRLHDAVRFGGPPLQLRGGLGDPTYLARLATLVPGLRGKPDYAQYDPGFLSQINPSEGQLPQGVDTRRLLSAIFGALGAARGGTGGLLAGLGGVASIIPGGGLIGSLLSGFGGLFSLFSGGGAKVSIARLEEEALEQMRSVQQIPQNVSVVSIGTNGRATKQALDYATGLDTSSRLPV